MSPGSGREVLGRPALPWTPWEYAVPARPILAGGVGNSVIQRVDHGVVQTFGEIALRVKTSEDADTSGELCHAKVSAENQRNDVGRTALLRSSIAVGFSAACMKAALRFLSTRRRTVIKKILTSCLGSGFKKPLALRASTRLIRFVTPEWPLQSSEESR